MEDDAEGCGRGEAGVGIVGGNRYSNWYINSGYGVFVVFFARIMMFPP